MFGNRRLPATEELSIRAQLLEEGGPVMWHRFMAELREAHLGRRVQPDGQSVAEQLQTAYEDLRARRARSQI